MKVTDLGLALQVEDEDERVTRDGTTVGTVDYMAPEQARDSRATSIRSDLYSLGCTFYYLLAGTAPFAGGDVGSKLRRHALEAPPDIRAARPDVPPALARLIQRMMAKSPNARFADYEQLIRALSEIPTADDRCRRRSPARAAGRRGRSVLLLLPRARGLVLRPGGDGGDAGHPGRVARSGRGPRRTGPDGSRVHAGGLPGPPGADRPTAQAPMLREILDDEAPAAPPAADRWRSAGASEPSTEEYIGRGLLIGLAIALAGLGLYYAASTLTPRSPDPAPGAGTVDSTARQDPGRVDPRAQRRDRASRRS